MGQIDLSKFTFSGDTIRSLAELTFDAVITGQDFSTIHTIYPNIVTNREIGFVVGGGLVGKASQGCNPTAQDFNTATRLVTFSPKQWEILLAMCYQDLDSTVAVYSRKMGKDIADLEGTDYEAIILESLSIAANHFFYRLTWFNDTDIANIEFDDDDVMTGTLTDGVDTSYFNLIDGFFKQMETQVATNSKQYVAISENAGATYTAQAIDPDAAAEYLKEVYLASDIRLRAMPNKAFYVTRSVYDAYQFYLSDKGIESTYDNLVNGMPTLYFQGIPVIAMDIWDLMIQSYFNTGEAWISPNRIVLTSPDILGVGIDDPNAFDSLNVWYNKDERVVKIEGLGQSDVQLMNPEMFVIAI